MAFCFSMESQWASFLASRLYFFFMLNSTEHAIHPAPECWYFNIYLGGISRINIAPEKKSLFSSTYIFFFVFYGQFNFLFN